MHQSIPACPSPHRANPWALAFFLNGKIPGMGINKSVKRPEVGAEKEGKCPTPGIIQKATLLKI